MDRRTALVGIIGVAGAGMSLRWSRESLTSAEGGKGTESARAQPALRMAGSGGIKSVSIAQVPLGAGGSVTGIDVTSDGQRLACRTDVGNAYVRERNEQAWRPFFSPSTMLALDYDPLPPMAGKADAEGVAGIRIAPSDGNTIFASFHGYIWKSEDGGRSVRRTRLPQKTMFSNTGRQRLYNRTIDIHPHDPRSVIVGTWGEGAWFSANGGETWGQAQLPQAGESWDDQPGLYLVAFDPSHPDRVYVYVTGIGLFRSDSGPGGGYRELTGGPKVCSSLVIGRDATVYLCEPTPEEKNGQVWRYLPASGWSPSQPEHEMFAIAIDPADPKRLLAVASNNFFMDSVDGGQSFRPVGKADWRRDRGEARWTRGLNSFFPSEILFDSKQPGLAWLAQGVGVAKGMLAGSSYQVEDWSAGIEELVAVGALCVPGGKTFLSAWDKPFWRVDDLDAYDNDFRYPLRPGKKHDASLVAYSSHMDFAGDDARFMVGIVAPTDVSAPGYTTNGGDSWQAFKGEPAGGWGLGGCIAASTKQNFVLLPSNNATGAFTLDGGATWAPIRLDGSNPTGNFANAYYVTRKNVTADKTRAGTFALVYSTVVGDGYGNPLGGVWLTRDGGKTWEQVLKGVVSAGSHDPKAVMADGQDARQFWQCQIEYVPARPGELVYTPHADFADDRFFWSADDGRNWAELHRKVRNVRSFGFGKAAPGQNRPAVYFWGKVDRKEGLYVSFDWFATVPMLVTRYPSQLFGTVVCVAADLDRFGRAYVGTAGTSLVRIDVEV
jgi:hypothetical protein